MQLVKVGLCAFGMSGKVFHAPFLKEHPGYFMSAVVERSKTIQKRNTLMQLSTVRLKKC